jgi:hypothetical protein
MIPMTQTDRLRKALREIAEKKGQFTFIGLLMRADAPGTWDLVVSAPWIHKGKLKAVSELTELLTASLGEHSLRQFARIVPIDAMDPRLKHIFSTFRVEDGEVRVQGTDLFGLNIEEAVILRAKRAA